MVDPQGWPDISAWCSSSCGFCVSVPGFFNVKKYDTGLLGCLVWQNYQLDCFFYLNSFIEALSEF